MKLINNKLKLDAKRYTIIFFSSLLAIVLSCIYFISRFGFHNPLSPIVKTLLLSFYIICFPGFYKYLSSIIDIPYNKSYFSSDSFLTLTNFFMVLLVAYFSPFLSYSIFYIFGFMGFLFFMVVVIKWLSSNSLRYNFLFLLIFAIFSVWMAAHIWGKGYQTPLIVENIIFDNVHIDTIYHAAIAGMIKTYGVPSTGIYGIVFRPYHFGSHWIFAQLSKLLNMHVVDFYQLAYPLIFIPFLLQSFLFFALDLKKYFPLEDTNFSQRKVIIFWLVFFILLMDCIPAAGLALRNGLHTISESYVVALIFFFSALTLGIYSFNNNFNFVDNDHFLKKFISYIFVLPVLTAIITLSKVSVGYLVLCLCVYLFIKMKLYKDKIFTISMIFTMLVTINILFLINKGQLGLKMQVLNTIIYFTTPPLFYIFHYLFSLLYIAYRIYDKNIVTVKDLAINLEKNKILDVEIIALLCIAGSLPFIFFKETGGGEFYFTDVQNVVVVPFLLANLDKIYNLLKFEKIKFNNLYDIKIKQIIITFIVSCFIIKAFYIYIYEFKTMVKYNFDTRLSIYYTSINNNIKNIKEYTNKHGLSWYLKNEMKKENIGWSKIINNDTMYNKIKNNLIFSENIINNNKKMDMVNSIYKLGSMELNEKKKTILFIPQSNHFYWRLCSNKLETPFIAPALSEMAMIDGLPEYGVTENDYKKAGYGYLSYNYRQKEQLPLKEVLDEIYQKANSKGFSKLIVLDSSKEISIILKNYDKNKSLWPSELSP